MRNISRLKHKVTGVNIIFSKSVFASIFPTVLKENIINKIHAIILPVVFSEKYFLYKSTSCIRAHIEDKLFVLKLKLIQI